MSLSLSAIYLYPVKSCAGTRVASAAIGRRGINFDRQWMVVDKGGRFISQRQKPAMALVRPLVSPDGGLLLSAPGMPALAVEPGRQGEEVAVVVWSDCCLAVDQGERAAAWFEEFLGLPCRLVSMAESFARLVDCQKPVKEVDEVGFADGYPFLLTTDESLACLNARLAQPVPVDRFRPNLVVAGSGAFSEDGWRRIKIADIEFVVVKPCARCSITTVDQATGTLSREPLATLSQFRSAGNEVHFGLNLVHCASGVLREGDPVQVVEQA